MNVIIENVYTPSWPHFITNNIKFLFTDKNFLFLFNLLREGLKKIHYGKLNSKGGG